MSEQEAFPKPTVEDRELRHDDVIEHREYGPMTVDCFSWEGLSPKVELREDFGSGPTVKLVYTQDQLEEAWGEDIHFDPEIVNSPRVGLTGISAEDSDISVDIVVEGEQFGDVEKVAIHARAEAVHAMRALETGETPDNVEPHDVRVDWESLMNGGDTE